MAYRFTLLLGFLFNLHCKVEIIVRILFFLNSCSLKHIVYAISFKCQQSNLAFDQMLSVTVKWTVPGWPFNNRKGNFWKRIPSSRVNGKKAGSEYLFYHQVHPISTFHLNVCLYLDYKGRQTPLSKQGHVLSCLLAFTQSTSSLTS
jgi:hypothetical protein